MSLLMDTETNRFWARVDFLATGEIALHIPEECELPIRVLVSRGGRSTEYEPSNLEKPNNSTSSKMEQVDKPKTQTETQNSNLTFEKTDEPQEEVIRCKDCKHSDTVTYPSGITEMTCPIMFETDCDDPFCGTWLIVDPNDFCSYGEVRDE